MIQNKSLIATFIFMLNKTLTHSNTKDILGIFHDEVGAFMWFGVSFKWKQRAGTPKVTKLKEWVQVFLE